MPRTILSLPDAEVPLSPMTAKILKMCMLEARLLKKCNCRYGTCIAGYLERWRQSCCNCFGRTPGGLSTVFEQLSMKSTNPNAGMGILLRMMKRMKKT